VGSIRVVVVVVVVAPPPQWCAPARAAVHSQSARSVRRAALVVFYWYCMALSFARCWPFEGALNDVKRTISQTW